MRIATFDVGGTFIKYCLVDDGQISERGKVPTPAGKDDHEAFLQALKGVVEQLAPVDGAAFSLPGAIDVDARYLKTGGALLHNYDVDASAWEDVLGVPVEIENDARCGAIAEYEVGNLQGVDVGLVLTFGTGIGGGIVVGGEVYKGHNLYAGEASMIYLETPGSASMADGSFAGACSTISLNAQVAAAKGVEALTGEQVFEMIEAGDAQACAAFEAFCATCAREIHNIQCLIDPERICLGGGVSQNPFFVKSVKEAVEKFNGALPFPFPNPEIVPCKYFNDANLIGAYQHFLRMRRKRAAA